VLPLSPEQAIFINQQIDKFHNPEIWGLGLSLSLLAFLETYLPAKEFFHNYLDKILTYFKLFFLSAFAIIFFQQGLFGGCLIQIPQNYIAKEYLGREYWYPYGLVYREFFNPEVWWVLQLFYLIIGSFTLWKTWVYFKKFVYKKAVLRS
jgi:hypothetical protein